MVNMVVEQCFHIIAGDTRLTMLTHYQRNWDYHKTSNQIILPIDLPEIECRCNQSHISEFVQHTLRIPVCFNT